jgi:hypothetical protein
MTNFYETFVKEKPYDEKLQKCIKETVNWLLTRETDVKHPGLLLGMIQSGKTRAFIGVIARAFDEGYDVAVVLTKGTKALSEQTLKRLQGEFKGFIDDELVRVYDIMKLPPKLTKYILDQKLIFIVKKEDDNLHRLEDFVVQYPVMQEKRVLIIDDEADFASIGYRTDKSKPDEMEINPLAKQISQFRAGLKGRTDFLQVTATPYSLYLQPEAIRLNECEYQPVRPAFTSLVPIHNLYVGGKFYFEDSFVPESTACYLHVNVPEKEIDVLGKKDERYSNNILTTPNLDTFRSAIVNFIVAGSIRNLQNKQSGQRRYKCSFIIHTETSKPKHEWQMQLVKSLVEKQLKSATEAELKELLNCSYEHFLPSLKLLQSQLTSYYIPSREEVYKAFENAIYEEHVDIRKINSDNDVLSLLDEKGQLKLDNPFNIFIGGQILDRGLTIENLIGFFYGRNPKKFQQDTVLQHSRMYGVRSKEDLAVTRLYTSGRIYNAMKKMYEFDMALRESFEKGDQKDGVVFIQKAEDGSIIPCAPGKILPASTTTLKPYTTLRAMGFQTKDKTHIAKTIEKIDGILREACGHKGEFDNQFRQPPFPLPLEQALSICGLINDTFEYSDKLGNEAYTWNVEEFKSVIKYLCTSADQEKIWCYVRGNREISRLKEQSKDFNSPDGGPDRTEAKKVAKGIPCLILLKQKGRKDDGWRDAEFWWPVLMTSENTKTCVFASETQE